MIGKLLRNEFRNEIGNNFPVNLARKYRNKYNPYIIDLTGGGSMSDETDVQTTEDTEKFVWDLLIKLYEDQTGKTYERRKISSPEDETA